MINWGDDRKLVEKEFVRLGFDIDARWRISDLNKDFELCNTYPRFLIVPANFTDENLESVAKFRYFRRIPTAVWRHLKNGCIIVRSSQPTVGWFGWFRNELDENLVHSYVSNTMPPINEETNKYLDNADNNKITTQTTATRTAATTTTTITTTTSTTNGNNSLVTESFSINHQNINGMNGNQDNHYCNLHETTKKVSLQDNVTAAVAETPPPPPLPPPLPSLQNTTITTPLPATFKSVTPPATTTTTTTMSTTPPSTHKPAITTSKGPDTATSGEEETKLNSPINITDNHDDTPALNSKPIAVNGNESPSPTTTSPPITTSKMLIIDARSYTAAMANRAKGGGCECSEYYLRCEVHFMNLANIHSIRKSYHAIRSVCEAYSEQSNNWVSFLDNSRWLHHISGLLKSAILVVDTIDIEDKSILIHCSDGWDRTPQLVALAEIMLDPHYRTFDGFRMLVQREWLDFGHKFADRCGSNPCNEDPNERCPVFLQWLDCVQQLLVQYPKHFEFNSSYLDKLNRHTYSNVFATFSYNSTQERILSRVDDKLSSLWAYFDSTRGRYKNVDYVESNEILRPSYKVRDLHFWKEMNLQGPFVNRNKITSNPLHKLKMLPGVQVSNQNRADNQGIFVLEDMIDEMDPSGILIGKFYQPAGAISLEKRFRSQLTNS